MLIGIERAAGKAAPLSLDDLPAEPLVCAISLSELRVGMLLADTEYRAASRARFLSRVLQRAEVLSFGAVEARHHADLRVALQQEGRPIGAADLIIAATALANGHSVMTNNLREFERVPGLDVVRGPAAAN